MKMMENMKIERIMAKKLKTIKMAFILK